MSTTPPADHYVHLVRHGEASRGGELHARGVEQARLAGHRLAALPVATVHHGPLPRAKATARLLAEALPDVPLREAVEVGDYVPGVGDPAALPAPYAAFLAEVTAEHYAAGSRLADAAIARFAVPTPDARHDVIVTHAFCVAWFVRHALDAPAARWVGLDVANGAITTIRYRADRPPVLVRLNDQAHLPDDLRWTGFPADRHC